MIKIMLGAVAGAMMLLVTVTASADVNFDAEVPVHDGCYVDWNGDGYLSFTGDIVRRFDEGGPAGFYYEWYIGMYYSMYWEHFFEGIDPMRTDWNGNGFLDDGDLFGYKSEEKTEGFYLTWAYIFYSAQDPLYEPYMMWIPEQNCIGEVDCNYHSDCRENEYCAGDGCGANDGTCDPYLPNGVCTQKRDPAECDNTVIMPMCGCNAELYLNECLMEAAGDRFANPGICSAGNCSGYDAHHECPCNHVCASTTMGGWVCVQNS